MQTVFFVPSCRINNRRVIHGEHKKAIEEVTEKEIPRAAYEGVLTIDVDAQVESAQEQEDTRWHSY